MLLPLLLLACGPEVGVVKNEVDADGDGYLEQVDCNDAHAEIHPGADEGCDGIDQDCDGVPDDDPVDAPNWYADADGDTYGDPGAATAACEAPLGTVADDTDCDDGNPDIHPGAPEPDCTDPTDYDCDLEVAWADADADGVAACVDCDDADPAASAIATFARDRDGDGHGDASTTVDACTPPTGYVADATDCDDYDSGVNPAAIEVCDGIDDDCDGLVDDDDPSTDAATWTPWYRDLDGDTYGDATRVVTQCDAPTGYVADGTDCDDGSDAIHPGAAERCDAADVDEDCDTLADDDDSDAIDTTLWYADGDGDAYGAGSGTAACDAPSGRVDNADDCDDADAAVSPAGAEVCDGYDDDCDGLVDDEDSDVSGLGTWYTDSDGDGYGAGAATRACTAPTDGVTLDGDCDDADAAVSPAGSEVCDGYDDDCDALVDDDDPDVGGLGSWYLDDDGDGHGAGTAVGACSAPARHVGDADDCDDTTATVYPGASEVCDAVDQDCDGSTDDGCLLTGTFTDADAFARIQGNSTSSTLAAEITAVGDTDGDGLDEILVLSSYTTVTATNQGAAFLFEANLSGDYSATSAVAILTGEDSYDSLMTASPAGDVDGDGLDDLLVGSMYADPSGSAYTYEGGAWVVLGPVSGTVSLNSADGEIYGNANSRRCGYFLEAAGDIDGDGLDDIAVATGGLGSAESNYAAFFYGPVTGSSALLDGDIVVTGQASDAGMGDVAAGSDFDGDGVGDFVFGTVFDDEGGFAYGTVWVVLGAPVDGDVSMQADSFYTGDSANDWLGFAVEAPGDLDGDGYADLAFTTYFEDTSTVIYGPLPASGQASSVAGAVISQYTSEATAAPRGAGDLDGDGDTELLVSDGTASISGTSRGVVGLFDAPVGTLTPADAEIVFTGDADNDRATRGSPAGDMDGDGLGDLMIGVPGDDATAYGAVWLFSPW